jgi:hypothetical protein
LFPQIEALPVAKKLEIKEMRTRLIQKPEYIHIEPTVEFLWGPDSERFDGDVFYTYRLIEPGVVSARWSPFTSDRRAAFVLSQPGKYRFEVKAKNRFYEIEARVTATHEFFYEPEVSSAWSPGETALSTPPTDENSKEDKKAASSSKAEIKPGKRLSSPGPFGCGVQGRSYSTVFLMTVLSLLGLLGFRRLRKHPPQ